MKINQTMGTFLVAWLVTSIFYLLYCLNVEFYPRHDSAQLVVMGQDAYFKLQNSLWDFLIDRPLKPILPNQLLGLALYLTGGKIILARNILNFVLLSLFLWNVVKLLNPKEKIIEFAAIALSIITIPWILVTSLDYTTILFTYAFWMGFMASLASYNFGKPHQSFLIASAYFLLSVMTRPILSLLILVPAVVIFLISNKVSKERVAQYSIFLVTITLFPIIRTLCLLLQQKGIVSETGLIFNFFINQSTFFSLIALFILPAIAFATHRKLHIERFYAIAMLVSFYLLYFWVNPGLENLLAWLFGSIAPQGYSTTSIPTFLYDTYNLLVGPSIGIFIAIATLIFLISRKKYPIPLGAKIGFFTILFLFLVMSLTHNRDHSYFQVPLIVFLVSMLGQISVLRKFRYLAYGIILLVTAYHLSINSWFLTKTKTNEINPLLQSKWELIYSRFFENEDPIIDKTITLQKVFKPFPKVQIYIHHIPPDQCFVAETIRKSLASDLVAIFTAYRERSGNVVSLNSFPTDLTSHEWAKENNFLLVGPCIQGTGSETFFDTKNILDGVQLSNFKKVVFTDGMFAKIYKLQVQ